MEVLPVRRNPIRSDIALRRPKSGFFAYDQVWRFQRLLRRLEGLVLQLADVSEIVPEAEK